MTTVAFAPAPNSSGAPFQFAATLDGAAYTVSVMWLMFAQRWYLYIYDSNNNLVLCTALVSSYQGSTGLVNLVAGICATSTMYYYDVLLQFVIEP